MASPILPVKLAPFFGAARRYTEQVLGGPIVELESNPTQGVAAASLLLGNADRVGLLFVNLGANDVFIAVSAAVATTFGIRLTANGGNASFIVTEDFTLPTRQWFGIASGGSSDVYILEVVRQIYTPAPETP